MKKMRNFKTYISFILLTFFLSCEENIADLGVLVSPTNLQVAVDIEAGQTGNVTITPTADDVLSFHVYFGDDENAAPTLVTPGDNVTHRYTRSGQYTVLIRVVAFGAGGTSTTSVIEADLDVRLFIDAQTLALLAGTGSKSWIWDQNTAGHFGVGPPDGRTPDFFSATPNGINPCAYDDVLTFSFDAQDNYSYELNTNGETFMNWAVVQSLFPDANPQQFVDECRDIVTDNLLPTSTSFLVLTDSETDVQTITLGGSFMSYYSDIRDWEILELSENKLSVRGLQNNGELAWYFSFIPEGFTGGGGVPNFDNLVWSDEFDTDGAPNTANWNYDTGTGPFSDGWGNGESQFYTDRADNVVISNGTLKIIAKAEPFGGQQYTSARITSKDKYEFTYGRVEVRAKLPTAGGTWPAIWMLGAGFDDTNWPAIGEIDIMEHTGNDLNKILGTVHNNAGSGGSANGGETTVTDASEFHVYSIVWYEDAIIWYVDGTPFYTYEPANKNGDNYPYTGDFYFLLNVAMGGSLGGTIDPAFVEDTMEIDYIRVYQ